MESAGRGDSDLDSSALGDLGDPGDLGDAARGEAVYELCRARVGESAAP